MSASSSLIGVGPSAAALAHIPGDYGAPLIGQTLNFLRDPLAYCRDTEARFGPVSRSHFLFRRRVSLMSAEGNEFVLLDRDQNFSAHHGWHPVLGRLFPNGLMLRDGDDHRYQRRLLQPAFRKEALQDYLARMNPRILAALKDWRTQTDFHFYPAIKQLTLEMAAELFLGVELQSEMDRVNRDFVDLVEASAAVVRVPLLGRRYARGLAGRAHLEQFLRERIPARRAGKGSDLFSQMCRAVSETGDRYRDDEIIDHLIFVMMAAHDTTTSALTTIAYALARHPEWQQRLRQQAADFGKATLDHDDLALLTSTDWVLREALRMYPPLTTIMRMALKDCEIHGYAIPAFTSVNVFPIITHRLPRWWNEPETFDPERFSPARAEHKRHPFAWIPFGGGAHMCLGLHFAEMQVKAVLHPLLLAFALETPADYRIPYQLAPIAKPKDGLPMRLRPL